MAIFRKKKAQNLETELAVLRQRVDALDAKRQAAEADLTAATEARQRHHFEGDLDDAKTAQVLQDAVNTAASQIIGFEDAIAVVQSQIADIERRLDAEGKQAERNAAADALSRNLDVIEKTFPEYLTAARRFAEAAEAVGHFHYESSEMAMLVQHTQGQVEVAGAFAVRELRNMVSQIKNGAAPIPPRKPALAPVAVPEPAPETRRVFALRQIKWKDSAGRQQHGQQFEDCDLPAATAEKALRCGAVTSLDDDRRKQFRGSRGGHHVNPNAIDLLDLDALEGWSGARHASFDDPVLARADFRLIDRSRDEFKIAIPAMRVG